MFTSGATEAINTAVWGASLAHPGQPIIAAAVEHSAVREASARVGLEVMAPPVDRLGRIDVASVEAALDASTARAPAGDDPGLALVHCQWGNHEVGTEQPVHEIVTRCRERDVLVHVDAAAAAGHVAIAFDDLGADLLSVSAHKLGGPQGIGALLIRRGLRLDPFIVGGDQELARRGGMENVAAAVGFAAALDAANVATEAAHQRALTDRIIEEIDVAGVTPFGDTEGRLPHIVCLGVDGVEAEGVLLGLDQAGVAVHSGSSCSSESLEPSPVLQAMGVDADRSLRISVGWSSTHADIDAFLAAFPGVVARLRALAR